MTPADVDLVPPHDKEAEVDLLGCMLIDPAARPGALALLKPEDFFYDAHRAVFAAIRELEAEGEPVGPDAVAARLRARGQAAHLANGSQTLRDLAETVVPYGRDALAEIVHGHALRRRLAVAAQRAQEAAYDPALTTAQAVERAEAAIHAVGRQQLARDAATTADLTGDLADVDYDTWVARRPAVVSTGFPDLDATLGAGGLARSELFVIGARPSVGKTSLVCAVALAVASQGRQVVFFSIEMAADAIMQRLWAIHGLLHAESLRRHKIPRAEFGRLQDVMRAVAAMPITIDDNSGITVAGMRSLVLRRQARGDVGAVIIDYLQEMDMADGENENVQLQRLVKAIKAMAKDLRVPVILLSQLRRTDGQGEPTMRDLRGSGGIEQAADVIALLHAEAYNRGDGSAYRQKSTPVKVIIAKQRMGATRPVMLQYNPYSTRFASAAREDA